MLILLINIIYSYLYRKHPNTGSLSFSGVFDSESGDHRADGNGGFQEFLQYFTYIQYPKEKEIFPPRTPTEVKLNPGVHTPVVTT